MNGSEHIALPGVPFSPRTVLRVRLLKSEEDAKEYTRYLKESLASESNVADVRVTEGSSVEIDNPKME